MRLLRWLLGLFTPGRWAVRYGNYFPREVDSLWWSRRRAERRADELNARDGTDMWEVEGM